MKIWNQLATTEVRIQLLSKQVKHHITSDMKLEIHQCSLENFTQEDNSFKVSN